MTDRPQTPPPITAMDFGFNNRLRSRNLSPLPYLKAT
jgi:hypothetical protein